jgi:hypothetical protein
MQPTGSSMAVGDPPATVAGTGIDILNMGQTGTMRSLRIGFPFFFSGFPKGLRISAT